MERRCGLNYKKLRLPHGSKAGVRTFSIGLAPDTVDRISELVPERYRSAYIERAVRLLLALQTYKKGEIEEWVDWSGEAFGRGFVRAVLYFGSAYEPWLMDE